MDTTSNTGAEAPVSWTVRYHDAAGFDCMLTLRGSTGAEVLTKAEVATKWLAEHGATANGYAPQPEPVAQEETDPAWCPIHNTTMKRHEKDGQEWYSHKVGNEWCRGKESK